MKKFVTEHQSPYLDLSAEVSEILYEGKSDFQDIIVADSKEFGRMLVLDGVFQTSDKDEFIYHECITHIPLFLHPNPKNVLIIGGGDGGIRVGGLSVLFKAKGGGGDFKLDAGLHGAGSSGQECFQRGDAFRALRADKDAAKLKMGFAFHTGLMPLPAADTGDDEHQ